MVLWRVARPDRDSSSRTHIRAPKIRVLEVERSTRRCAMFEGSIGVNGDDTWCETSSPKRGKTVERWREVDHALRELARCRSATDADEARLLVIAMRDEIWKR